MSSRVALFGVALAAAATVMAFPALAKDTWTTLRPGIQYLKQAKQNLHFVKIDLKQNDLSVLVSKSEDRAQTPKKFAEKRKAYIAINGDFYDVNKNFLPLGLSISNGVVWPKTPFLKRWGFLACEENNECSIDYVDEKPDINPAWKNVIGGRDRIIHEGIPWTSQNDKTCGSLCTIKAPRTALGLSQDKSVLFLTVAEGRTEDTGGLTVSEVANALARVGAYEALHLDGGGSSQLVIGGKLISARPKTEPKERPVANHLGIVIQSK